MADEKQPARTSKVVEIRDSLTSIQGSDAPKPGTQPKSAKKKAQELAAHRELLLKKRNNAYVTQYLVNKTQFDKDEVKTLQTMYQSFRGSFKSYGFRSNKKPEQIDRLRFRDMIYSLFGITNNMMLDRIFNAFDGDSEGSVSETEWILGLSSLLRGTLDQQIAYTYDVYDINQDRSLGRDEVYNCLKGSMNAVPGVLDEDEIEDATKELSELVMKKFDIKRNGAVEFPEYRHVIRQDPLLLEVLGECLPEDQAAVPFVALLNANPRKFRHHFSISGDRGWSMERNRYNRKDRGERMLNEGFLHEEDEGRTMGKQGAIANPSSSLFSPSVRSVIQGQPTATPSGLQRQKSNASQTGKFINKIRQDAMKATHISHLPSRLRRYH